MNVSRLSGLCCLGLSLLPGATPGFAQNGEPEHAEPQRRILQIRQRWTELKPQYRGTPYQRKPALGPNFAPGVLQEKLLRDGLNMFNFVRFVAGVPDDVTLDEGLQKQAQCGALLLAYIKRCDHTPPRPPDFPLDLYQTGYRSTSSSNIAEGSPLLGDKIPGTPAAALADVIPAYMGESEYDVRPGERIAVGHRLAILNPKLQKTGMGFVNNFSTLQVFDGSRQDEGRPDFIAWPATGAHPIEFFAPQGMWSLSLNPSVYQVSSPPSVQVSVRRKRDGRTWEIGPQATAANAGDFDFRGAEDLLFRPHDIASYQEGDCFQVTVSGLLKTGTPTTLNYEVTFFHLGGDTTATTMQPRAGEILLEGTVLEIKDSVLSLKAFNFGLPAKPVRAINPPKTKTIVYKAPTGLLIPGSAPLRVGSRVQIVGPDRGTGAALTPRAILVRPARLLAIQALLGQNFKAFEKLLGKPERVWSENQWAAERRLYRNAKLGQRGIAKIELKSYPLMVSHPHAVTYMAVVFNRVTSWQQALDVIGISSWNVRTVDDTGNTEMPFQNGDWRGGFPLKFLLLAGISIPGVSMSKVGAEGAGRSPRGKGFEVRWFEHHSWYGTLPALEIAYRPAGV